MTEPRPLRRRALAAPRRQRRRTHRQQRDRDGPAHVRQPVRAAVRSNERRRHHVALHVPSLDAPLQHDDETTHTLADVLGSEDDRYELIDRAATIGPFLRTLPRREREALYMRFAHDMMQSEIAARIGCSQMQVSRLLRRALTRLADAHERPSPRRSTG
ncbi:MAG: sigma-70 family RNA polymerase sigma factor [Conexibacter sp.]